MTSFTPHRRSVVGGLAAAALIGTGARAQAGPVRIGFSISKTGPNAGGANTTTLPNYMLWMRETNEAGGLKLPGGQRRMIEFVEYDDRSQSEEAVRNIDRLVNQDKVDLLLPPWGTAMNLAVAPAFNRGGFPHLASTFFVERQPELVKRWTNMFLFLDRPSTAITALTDLLATLKDKGLGNTVAVASVQDQFGLELVGAARAGLQRAGFQIVMDRQYPPGTQDLAPIVAEAVRLRPEMFLAFSYPPDTLALTEQARIAGLNPKVFYTAVGTAFPLYKQRFGAVSEGVMGIGGVNVDDPKIRDYIARHNRVIGREPDRWASTTTYSTLQVLTQAIERVGLDKAALIRDIGANTFDTILGPIKFVDNQRVDQWWVGQWQGGEFVALAPTRIGGTRAPIFPKPAWPSA
jgi:branched-chain amino acid transport system substrate-binding protein